MFQSRKHKYFNAGRSRVKDKKKVGFSPLRVIIAFFIVGLLTALLILFDSALEQQVHYSDFNPLITRDGSRMVFVRWYWLQKDRTRQMEIWQSAADGSNASKIFSFEPRFHFYGLRFFRLSSDEKLVLARLLSKDPDYSFVMRDFVYQIPVDGSKSGLSVTELEKSSQYDMIMDFQDGTLLTKKIGGKKDSSIEFRSGDGKKVISSFSYPAETFCNAGTLYHGGDSAIVLFETVNPDRPVFRLVKLRRGISASQGEMGISKNIAPPLYLSSSRQFVSIDRNLTDRFFIIGEGLSALREIPNPLADRYTIFEISVSPDEKYIIHPSGKRLCRVDIDSGRAAVTELPVAHIVPPVRQNPVSGDYVFSDGKQLFSSREDGTGLKALTELSPKSRIEKNGVYVTYRQAREKCFGLLCRLFGVAYEKEGEEEHER